MNENKTPVFDPRKYLCRTFNQAGEPVMRLPLAYQKLWFRMDCPKGRMLLNPLRLTDQLAIFEAKVFFHQEDSTPASSFTASKTAQETPNYIRDAQDEALKTALDNAGFGIQLYDVTQGAGGGECSPAIQQTDGGKQPAPDPEPAPVQKAPTAAEPDPAPVVQAAPTPGPVPADRPVPSAQTVEAPTAEHTSDPVSEAQAAVQESPVTAALEGGAPTQEEEQDSPDTAAQEATPPDGGQRPEAVLHFPMQTDDTAAAQGTGAVDAGGAPVPTSDTPPQAAPSYTENMTVEEICRVMTLEEARKVVVTKGICKTWTMGQVAEQRPSSLTFYLSGFGGCDNIQLAAATLLTQDIEMKKAG